MVGLLTALPNTQLRRRLAKDRRLIDGQHRWISDADLQYELRNEGSLDQTIGGLNFVTMRDRVEIYRALRAIIAAVYSPQAYMDRVLDTTRRIKIRNKHLLNLWEGRRMLRGFRTVLWRMLADPRTRWFYLRNFVQTTMLNPTHFEYAHNLMGAFLHFDIQTQKMLQALD